MWHGQSKWKVVQDGPLPVISRVVIPLIGVISYNPSYHQLPIYKAI